ncbi:hypothetical protein [Haloferax sp. Q22]|uniref:hypothetical protein n=1 Tax=Haloferax sp. (strain Q22) TaxID=1526048 RepID=UPI000737B767|nr:hypothetical protein [Haloferax sp. Q22]
MRQNELPDDPEELAKKIGEIQEDAAENGEPDRFEQLVDRYENLKDRRENAMDQMGLESSSSDDDGSSVDSFEELEQQAEELSQRSDDAMSQLGLGDDED